MKYILTLALLLINIPKPKNDVLMMKPLEPLVFMNFNKYYVLHSECSICTIEELKVMVDCIKSRVEHEDFPNSLDTVLIQPYQFSLSQKNVSINFIKLVDSLWKMPKQYSYLYFRSKGYSYSKWMNKYTWIKPNNFYHEFGK